VAGRQGPADTEEGPQAAYGGHDGLRDICSLSALRKP